MRYIKKRFDIDFKRNNVTIDDELNIAKNINRSNKLYLIFLKQFAFFKYNAYFTLNNNI